MKEKTIAPFHLVPYLKEMLYELQTQRFRAFQVPDTKPSATKGKNIWVTETKNPKWYSELIRQYPKRRKNPWGWGKKANKNLREADSRIVRSSLEKMLTNFVKNGYSYSIYADDLLDIAKTKHKNNSSPLTEEEIYLWECHRIIVNKKQLGIIRQNNFSTDFLDFVAEKIKRCDNSWMLPTPF